jgi:DNA-binding GntR family transcriptional regulator
MRPVVPPVGEGFRFLDGYVYDALLEAIVQRRLLPGDRLVLDDLAEQLKVSRTPVRDALSRLASEGLVAREGRRGFTITALTPEELAELYDLRLMCELYAIEKGIRNASSELLREMANAVEQCVRFHESGNRLAAMLSDREFHRLLVTLGHNQRLTELVARLNIHIQTLRAGAGESPSSGSNARAHWETEHLAILEAIRSRDLNTARQAIRVHITGAAERAIASLQASLAAD